MAEEATAEEKQELLRQAIDLLPSFEPPRPGVGEEQLMDVALDVVPGAAVVKPAVKLARRRKLLANILKIIGSKKATSSQVDQALESAGELLQKPQRAVGQSEHALSRMRATKRSAEKALGDFLDNPNKETEKNAFLWAEKMLKEKNISNFILGSRQPAKVPGSKDVPTRTKTFAEMQSRLTEAEKQTGREIESRFVHKRAAEARDAEQLLEKIARKEGLKTSKPLDIERLAEDLDPETIETLPPEVRRRLILRVRK